MQFPDNEYSAVPSLSRTELCNATGARCRQGSWPQWRPHFDHLSVIRSIKLSRLRVKCDGTRAETRFHLLSKQTSPFKSAGASVQSTTGSWGVRISGSNVGYTVFRGRVKGTGHPLHLPVSPSLPRPCVTVCHHISTGLYHSNQILQLYSVKKHYLAFTVRLLIETGCPVIVHSFLSMLPKSIDTYITSHPLTWRYDQIQFSDVSNFKYDTSINIHKQGNSKTCLLIKHYSQQKSAWLIRRPTDISSCVALNAFNVKSN